MRALTAKQEAFAQAYVDGKDQSAAYRDSYNCPKLSPKNLYTEASRTLDLPHVAARIAFLRNQHDASRFLTREKKREILASFINGKRESVKGVRQLSSDQLKALEIDNRMAGHNEPDEVRVSGLDDLMKMIRE